MTGASLRSGGAQRGKSRPVRYSHRPALAWPLGSARLLAQVGQLLLDRGVVAGLHGERRRPAGHVAQVGRVAEQLGERDVGVDEAAALVGAEALDLTPPA